MVEGIKKANHRGLISSIQPEISNLWKGRVGHHGGWECRPELHGLDCLLTACRGSPASRIALALLFHSGGLPVPSCVACWASSCPIPMDALPYPPTPGSLLPPIPVPTPSSIQPTPHSLCFLGVSLFPGSTWPPTLKNPPQAGPSSALTCFPHSLAHKRSATFRVSLTHLPTGPA